MQTYTIDDLRFYQDNDKLVPSVTTVLGVLYKPHLEKWKLATKDWESVMYSAADFGTKIHNMIENWFLQPEISYETRQLQTDEAVIFNNFYNWFTKFKPVADKIELSCASSTLGYGGTIDFIGDINGEKWLIDWKTSNQFQQTYLVQAYAYAQLVRFTHGIVIDRVGVLHIKARYKKEGINTAGDTYGPGWCMHEVKDVDKVDLEKDMASALWLWQRYINTKPYQLVLPKTFKKWFEDVAPGGDKLPPLLSKKKYRNNPLF